MKRMIFILFLCVVLLSSCSNLSKNSQTSRTFQLKNVVSVTEEQIVRMTYRPIALSDPTSAVYYDDIQSISKNTQLFKFEFNADDKEIYPPLESGTYGINYYRYQEGNFAFIYQYKDSKPSLLMGYLYFPNALISKNELLKCKNYSDISKLDKNYGNYKGYYWYYESFHYLINMALINNDFSTVYTTIHLTDEGIFDVNYQNIDGDKISPDYDEKIIGIEKDENPMLNKIYDNVISHFD